MSQTLNHTSQTPDPQGLDKTQSALPAPLSKRQLLLQAANPQQPMRFNECKSLVEHFGFRLASMNRLHNIFVHDQVPELINLQNVDGLIKTFHVRQILNLIYKYQLRASDEVAVPFDPKAMP